MSDIVPNSNIYSYKTGTLFGVTLDQMEAVLGLPNVKDDPLKVRWSWGFLFQGIPCAAWDWKGSADYGEWSIYGPAEIWAKLFPNSKVAV